MSADVWSGGGHRLLREAVRGFTEREIVPHLATNEIIARTTDL